MSKKNKNNNIPLWAASGHRRPVTRREFLASGVIPFSASLMLPNWLNLLLPQSAQAAMTCPTPMGGMIPFITLNLEGGASMGGNFVPVDAGGAMLPTYNLMGLGKTPPVEKEFGNVPFGGMYGGALLSKFLEGVRTTSPTAISKTAFVAFCSASRDDSAENKYSVDGLLVKSGLVGTKIPNIGQLSNQTGIRQKPAVVPPTTPLIVNSFGALTNALNYAGSLSSITPAAKQALASTISRLSQAQTRKLAMTTDTAALQDVVDCAGVKNEGLIKEGVSTIDPRLDPANGAKISSIWGINTGTGGQDKQLIYSSIAFNVLNGQAGSAAIEIGGCDYHNNTRTTGDAKDLEVGQIVGRMLETANAMGKPLFIYLVSDGNTQSGGRSDTPGGVWTSDRGSAGCSYLLYFNPSGRPATSGFQVGHFTAGQVCDPSTPIGNSPEASACAVFANYLAVNKRLDIFESLVGRGLDSKYLNSVIKMA